MATQKEWYSSMRRYKLEDLDTRRHSEGRKLSDLTSDPEAQEYDEATEIFCNGVKLGRIGDYSGAAPQIACAYLLDSRSINFAMCESKDVPKDKLDEVLDYELYTTIVHGHPDQQSFAIAVLHIMLSSYLGPDPELGQYVLANSMTTISRLLTYIDEDMSIEDPARGILGGCLTRKGLLSIRSSLHMAMGNRKNALKDLTTALKIDEFYTTARECRACVWAACEIKDNATIHSEFKRVLKESHPDSRGLEITFAHLALTTLADPSLGTIDDAKDYYVKSLKATQRKDELYGKCTVADVLKKLYKAFEGNNPEAARLVAQTHGMTVTAAPKKHSCVFCGALQRDDGSSLLQCSRCKLVSYCSKECQKSDWKSHKYFCESATNAKPSTAKPKANPTPPIPQDQLIAKEPLETWKAMIGTTARMEEEFTSLYANYGKFFGDYWKKMTRKNQKSLLLTASNNSIPKSLPENQLTKSLVAIKPSLVSLNLNVETLCSECSCAVLSCTHFDKSTLLHEMSAWAEDSKEKFDLALRVAHEMREKDIFPNVFGGMFAFVETFENGPAFIVDGTSRSSEYRRKIAEGKLYDASAVWFCLKRKELSLSLFIKLFNIYQEKVRRQPSQNPFERLKGCLYCHRSCEDSSAKQCLVCKVSWFCCEGCKKAFFHDRCPHGQECDSAVVFE